MRIPSIPGFDQQAFEKYLKNTGWLLMAKVGSLIIKMVISTFVLSAYLGADQFGVLNYPMTIITFFSAIAALGLDGYVTRELLNRPESKNGILGTAFRMRLIAGIVTIPLVAATYYVINSYKPLDTPFNYVLIVAFTSVIQSVNIIDSFFQARVQAKKTMYVQVIGNVISALLKLVFILLKLPIVWFVYSLLFDAAVIAAGYIIAYIKDADISKWKFNRTEALHLLSNAWPLTFSALLVTIYMKIDQLMIPMYLKIEQLGVYITVANLSEAWYFFPVAVVTSVFPSIMHARKTDMERYRKRLQNMYDLMVVMSVGIAIITTFLSSTIYHIVYRHHPEYWSGAPVLAVHVWAGVFVFLGNASGQYLIAEGYNKLALVKTAIGALVNVVLNIFWIPKYGIMGAAYATLIGYGVSTFLIVLLPQTRAQGLAMLKSLFLVSLLSKVFKR